MANENPQKSPQNFACLNCDYFTCNKKDYTKHLRTAKHLRLTNTNEKLPKCQSENLHKCNCGKIYKHMSSLCKHKAVCDYMEDKNIEEEKEDKEDTCNTYPPATDLILNLLNDNKELRNIVVMQSKENGELKHMMMEVIKNGVSNTTNTNNTNTNTNTNSNNNINNNNKTFNLQIFLNETCKNAMNIMDFVDDIVLTLSDLEETGRIGFAEGISKMINRRLKAMDVTQRPIHCSDLKRETLYVKNQNRWEKEDDNNPLLTTAVKHIAGKNMMQIFDWQKAHPDYNDPDTRTSDRYMKMLTNVMSGGTEEEIRDNYEKIVRNIIKETGINKENYLI